MWPIACAKVCTSTSVYIFLHSVQHNHLVTHGARSFFINQYHVYTIANLIFNVQTDMHFANIFICCHICYNWKCQLFIGNRQGNCNFNLHRLSRYSKWNVIYEPAIHLANMFVCVLFVDKIISLNVFMCWILLSIMICIVDFGHVDKY